MGRKGKNGLSEEKRNIIGQLIEMYGIRTTADIQKALKDLPGGMIQGTGDYSCARGSGCGDRSAHEPRLPHAHRQQSGARRERKQ